MPAIITAILDGIVPIWTFVTTTFVPATSSDVTLVHFGMWAGTVMGFAFTFLSLIRRGSSRR